MELQVTLPYFDDDESFIHSFIHSFILNIYIAPLQESHSEALPTPAWSKRAVLRSEKTQMKEIY